LLVSFFGFVPLVVDFCRRRAAFVLIAALAGTVALGFFVATHVRINTDVNQLLAADLDWRKREVDLEKAFPQKVDRLVVVIDGENADVADAAADALSHAMAVDTADFSNVVRPESIPFFQKNGILFLSEDEIATILEGLTQGQPILGTFANDPSLRGLFGAMDLVVKGVAEGAVTLDQLDKPLGTLADALDATRAGSTKPFPWRSLMMPGEPKLRDTRKFILTQPHLDYEALSPGHAASEKVRALAHDLGLTAENGVRVRLTGTVALNDDEFASVADGTTFATILSGVLVLVILFLALRSFRLILPILITLIAGLIATTAFALAALGSLNLISVAFAVMFVGVAVDFGIQFGVRYRGLHHDDPDNARAMIATAKIIAKPLALAAASIAIGLLAFLPTDYRGVAELGLISGVGMVIAFFLNISLLPALLAVFCPPPEREAIGFTWAAPIDAFLITRRRWVLGGALLVALAAGGIATQMRFDFDPLNLKNPHSESMSTLFDLMVDPDATPYTVEILSRDLNAAKALATKIDALPQVDHTITLASFVPEDQDKKLPLLNDAASLLGPTLAPLTTAQPPSTDETLASMSKAADALRALGDAAPAGIKKLTASLDAIVAAKDPALLERVNQVLIEGLQRQLESARRMLAAERVTIDAITPDLRNDWITADGRAKIEVYPKGNPRDPKVLSAFTTAVRAVAPEASGSSISIQESGATIVNAFIKAGLLGMALITVVLAFALRKTREVVFLLIPIFLAGALTLATMVIIRLPLNFANIIAFPLLLSLGVSYAIYFITGAEDGLDRPLQSSMARAVLFSAATTLVAFGSLALSAHVGTSGMGKLLTIALLYCLLCTFVVLPALLGQNRSQ
jgi:hopanoid biosynthesis associated RND transporter like protein HpnN